MDNIDNRVRYLFNLYYNKQANQNELDELFERLKELNDEQLTYLLQKTWGDTNTGDVLFDKEKSKAILNSILNAGFSETTVVDLKPKQSFGWLKIAAAIVVSLSIGAYFLTKNARITNNGLAKNQVAHDALPGSNKAILTLANGSKIVLDNSHNGIVAKQKNALIFKNADGQVDYKSTNEAAADNIVAYNTITTPKGYQYQVVLPDGSKVWLNAASSLKFPTAFNGKERDVEVTGEAYFEVAKNPDMPFIVKVNREEVRVLGTHFCIMAYDDEKVLATTLLEGSIMLTSGKSVHILKPGNQAILNAHGDVQIIEYADIEEAIAWKNGLFRFKDDDVATIMRQAARWYDVDVSYQGKTPIRQFTGTVPRNVKLSELLNMFKYTGINFSIDDKKVTVIN
jgi:transmembrane sensor